MGRSFVFKIKIKIGNSCGLGHVFSNDSVTEKKHSYLNWGKREGIFIEVYNHKLARKWVSSNHY